jgi:type IV pilus assembly protein PilC
MQNIHFSFFKKVSLVEKFNFYEYLSVMLDGGVTISETLESVQTKIKNTYFKEKIRELETFVSSGDSFSKSMKKIPQVFSPAEISMIESGETTGKLSLALAHLSENLQKSYDLRSKIKGALTYPAIIFLFLILAVVIVLIYVIPAVSQLFETSDVALPLATRALVASSNFMIHQWAFILLFVATAGVLFYGYKNTPKGKANLDYFLLALPLA